MIFRQILLYNLLITTRAFLKKIGSCETPKSWHNELIFFKEKLDKEVYYVQKY
jgi:hypothetical protein